MCSLSAGLAGGLGPVLANVTVDGQVFSFRTCPQRPPPTSRNPSAHLILELQRFLSASTDCMLAEADEQVLLYCCVYWVLYAQCRAISSPTLTITDNGIYY